MEDLFRLIETYSISEFKKVFQNKKLSPDITNRNGENLLSYAIIYNNVDIVEYLLEQGADINMQDKTEYKYTPIMYSLSDNNLKTLQLLIDKGADLENLDSDGKTALFHSAIQGYYKSAELLIKKGANINAKAGYPMLTPLHFICLRYGQWQNSEDIRLSGQVKVLKLLIENGAELEDEDMYGKTPLYIASTKGAYELLDILIKYKANVNNVSKQYGATPLMGASETGQLECVKLLIENGANINHRDNDGFTALILASCMGQTEIVKYLMEKGADKSIVLLNDYDKCKKGMSAYDVAIEYGNEDIADLIR